MDQAVQLLKAGNVREAETLFTRLIDAAEPLQRGAVAHQAGLEALKHSQPQLAVRLLRRAAELLPRDPEPAHDRGLAHLEAGEVGLAALAQREALDRDPDHSASRAHLAAALEALGDDAGAAHHLDELLKRLGPQPALTARVLGIRASARTAAAKRLAGAPPQRLAASTLAHSFARAFDQPLTFRAPFATLQGTADGASLRRLDLVFDSMDGSMGRSDLLFGGSTQEEDGRRVPLDEFTAAGVIFLGEALGIEPLRARRLLSFLLTPECGLGPHRFAGCLVGWTLQDLDGERRYGLYVEVRLDT